MVDILGEILPQIKDDLAKTIVAQLDLNELATKLYPLLQKIDERNPKKIMEKHIQQMQKQYNTLDNKFDRLNNRIIVVKNK